MREVAYSFSQVSLGAHGGEQGFVAKGPQAGPGQSLSATLPSYVAPVPVQETPSL